jgi:hypothetical protein
MADRCLEKPFDVAEVRRKLARLGSRRLSPR